jgi:hypothetical protein
MNKVRLIRARRHAREELGAAQEEVRDGRHARAMRHLVNAVDRCADWLDELTDALLAGDSK